MLKKMRKSVEDDVIDLRKSVEVGSQVLEGEDERECRPDGGWGGALPRCSEFFSIMGMVMVTSLH